MTTLTITDARDEALAIIKAAMDGTAPYDAYEVIYTDSADDVPKDAASWMRVMFRHTDGEQASLTDDSARHRWERRGLLSLQGFHPTADGQNISDAWLQLMLDSLEGVVSPGGIIFRNVSPREIGQNGDWYQSNVIAEFEYDQIK